MVAGPPFIKKVTPIASAASCLLAPARAAAWAWEAMQPSQPSTTPIARAISSFVAGSSAPGAKAALWSSPLVDVRDRAAQFAVQGVERVEDVFAVRVLGGRRGHDCAFLVAGGDQWCANGTRRCAFRPGAVNPQPLGTPNRPR